MTHGEENFLDEEIRQRALRPVADFFFLATGFFGDFLAFFFMRRAISFFEYMLPRHLSAPQWQREKSSNSPS